MRLGVSFSLIAFLWWLASSDTAAEPQLAQDLAAQYASCAAYYLMISKADPRLKKYGQVGAAAADNARRLSSTDSALTLMSNETKHLLVLMEHDWSNAGVIIKQKAEPCKKLMTVDE